MKLDKIAVVLFFFLVFFISVDGQIYSTLDQAYTSGKISTDEVVLNKIYCLFEPSKVNKSYYKGYNHTTKMRFIRNTGI